MEYVLLKKYLIDLFFKIFIYFKNTYVIVSTLIISFFCPIQKLIFLCIVLAILDLFVKLYVVYNTKGYDEIKSSKISNTLFKIVFYSVSMIVVHGIDLWFVKDIGFDFLKIILGVDLAQKLLSFKLVGGIAFIIMIRELKSIDESWEEKFGWSFFKTIESRLPMFKIKK